MMLLDMKQGDVNGDGVADNVYLIGNKAGETAIFADNITLVVQDGRTGENTTVNFQNNAGYNARLFLGDFSKDNVPDVLVSIDSGGSGGYGFFYIYSFQGNLVRTLFDVDLYNKEYVFRVNYEDFYKVSVGSTRLNVLFTIDISYKGYDYLSQFYDEGGKLKQPIQGEVLALGAVYPVVTDPKSLSYDLLAIQRIIGTTNADTLGFVENFLTWNGIRFESSRLTVSIPGTPLAIHY